MAIEADVEDRDALDAKVEGAETPDGDGKLDLLTQQVAALTKVVAAQQATFSELQDKELRVSDAMAIRREGLEIHGRMTARGWEVNLSPGITQGHINQFRLAARMEIQQMATRMRQERGKQKTSYRKGGNVPAFGENE